MVTIYKKDDKRVLVGMVEQVRYAEKNGERLAIVRLTDRNDDKIDIFFKNDLSAPENPKKLADRVEKAKVEAGKWLAVLVFMKSDDAATATGVDFKYTGVWSFDQGQDAEGNDRPRATVIAGYSTSPTRVNEGLFRVSMAEKTYDSATQTEGTKWYSIAFFDDDRELLAKKTEKLLTAPGRKSVPCAIRCSAVRETTKGNRTYYNLTGYHVETMYSSEAANETENTEAA